MTPCVQCEREGRGQVAALRVTGRGALCRFHYEGKGVPPPLLPASPPAAIKEEGKGMPAAKQFDEAQLRADVEAGFSVNHIAAKHKSTWATVKAAIDRLGLTPAKGVRADRVAQKPSTAVVVKARKPEVRTVGDMREDGRRVLADLKLKRGALDAAIVGLEAIYG